MNTLRTRQFAEDAGPLAHPIRPDAYIEINNFYTLTVYEKGAEIVRMLHTLLGAEGFRKGSDLYFERHDGQAVTCDDLVSAMEAANGVDLSLFRRWYAQTGTPVINVSQHFDAEQKTLTLTFSQYCPPTRGQTVKEPLHIPVTTGLIRRDGTPARCELLGGAAEDQVVLIAVSPSHPDVLYVGSGEGLHRPDLGVGDGIFKSTDGGKTWRHVGLPDVQQVGRLVVHPTDPDVVFVAGMGHPYGPNEERGVFRTTDGGRSWDKVLYVNHNTGASQVEIDPSDPRTVYASLWEHREGPWENGSFSGPHTGLFKSEDGGSSWRRLTAGLPQADGAVSTSSPTPPATRSVCTRWLADDRPPASSGRRTAARLGPG